MPEANDQAGFSVSLSAPPVLPQASGSSPLPGNLPSAGPLTHEEVRRMVSEMLERSEKSVDLKISNIEQRIDNKLSRLEHIPTTTQLVGWAIGIIIGVIALYIALFQMLGDRWDDGLATGSAIGERFERNDQQNRELNKQLERIIERLDGDAKAK